MIIADKSHMYVHCMSIKITCTVHVLYDLQGELEELGMLCVKLATKFLFHCGFHTKKTLR